MDRPTGSKDSKPRAVSGYYLREAPKKKSVSEGKGHYKSVQAYL